MKIVTHNGSFHPDEIFAVATLLIHFKGEHIEIKRSRDPDVIASADIVVDVGMEYDAARMRFDHHQGGIDPRSNGILHASFGLVWKRFGESVCGAEPVARYVEEKLVMPIDALDNGQLITTPVYPGVEPYTIFDYILSHKPTWNEDPTSIDELFLSMVTFARGVLEREIKIAHDDIEGMRRTEEAYQASADKRIIVLDKYYEWELPLSRHPEPVFVTYPGLNGDEWHIQCVRDNPANYVNRKDFPAEWAGKKGDDLVAVTGVADALFAHKGRFFAAARSKEGAVKLAELALSL